jgi:hypothetical protein
MLTLPVLTACDHTYLKDPETGQVVECYATGMYPLQNELKCRENYRKKGWQEIQGDALTLEALDKIQYQEKSAACLQHFNEDTLYQPLRGKIDLGQIDAVNVASVNASLKPTSDEKGLILAFLRERKGCISLTENLFLESGASDAQLRVMTRSHQSDTRVLEALSRGELSYGETATVRRALLKLKEDTLKAMSDAAKASQEESRRRHQQLLTAFESQETEILASKQLASAK